MNKNKLTVFKDGRTHVKRKFQVQSFSYKEKSDAAEGQANKTLGKDGKLSWWSGG